MRKCEKTHTTTAICLISVDKQLELQVVITILLPRRVFYNEIVAHTNFLYLVQVRLKDLWVYEEWSNKLIGLL